MDGPYDEAFFYVVEHDTTLRALSHRLYGSESGGAAEAFLRINRFVPYGVTGELLTGQVLFLPGGECRSDEAAIRETLTVINRIVTDWLTAQERRVLARHHALAHNAAADPRLLRTVTTAGATAANGLLGATQAELRLIERQIRSLEDHYFRTLRLHGRLTNEFFSFRERVYATLDTRLGRLARAITIQTPVSESAKRALRIGTTRQVLHWQSYRSTNRLRAFEEHFENIARVSRYLKWGGYVTMGLDVGLRADTVFAACQDGGDTQCLRTAAGELGGFTGSTLGSSAGGTLAYSECNAIFGVPTEGASLLLCGLVAGPAGTLGGGALGDWLGRHAGVGIFYGTKSVIEP